MNMWGFPAKEGCVPTYLMVLEDGFKEFFEKEVKENPFKAEYLLPTHIGGLLRAEKCSVKVLETKDKWFGVTYKEDEELVVNNFKKLIADSSSYYAQHFDGFVSAILGCCEYGFFIYVSLSLWERKGMEYFQLLSQNDSNMV